MVRWPDPFALFNKRSVACLYVDQPGLMDCAEVAFSGHAIRRIFERALGRDAILEIVRTGEVIAEYPDDSPHPSCLLLGFVSNEPLHVVVAREAENRRCFVVPAYRLDLAQWSDDLRKRRQ